MNVEIDENSTERPERALGSKCGVVSRIQLLLPERPEETLTSNVQTTSLVETLPLELDRQPQLGIGGKGRTIKDMLFTSVGEFAERYCLHWPAEYVGEEVLEASYADLRERGVPALDPKYVDVYNDQSAERAGFRCFDSDSQVKWIPGRNLVTGETLYLPTELVVLVAQARSDEKPYYFTTSNGCACGSSLPFALLESLYEVIERDAIMRSWYAEEPPTRIDLDDWPKLRRRKETFETDYVSCTVVEFETEVDVHVAGVLRVDERDRLPKFLLSAGADIDFESAVMSALEEAKQGERVLKSSVAYQEYDNDIDIQHVYNLDDNLKYYVRPENFGDVEFLFEGPTRRVAKTDETTAFADAETPEKLRACVESLDVVGARPIALDLTLPDVRELGMHVTKVYVPELVDLMLPSMPSVDHPRFDGVKLNPNGHPFP